MFAPSYYYYFHMEGNGVGHYIITKEIMAKYYYCTEEM